MDRRKFLGGIIMTSLLPLSMTAVAGQTFLNGELNYSQGTFDWTNGGGDPLRSAWRANSFQKTLSISRLNLPRRTQNGLRQTLKKTPFSRVNLARVYEGKVLGDVMISGNGQLALRPRLVSDRWRAGRSTMASWWTWTDVSTGERWEMLVPDVCSNLILTRLGQAAPCVCDASVGDACT